MHIKSAMRSAAGKLILWLNMLNKSDMRIVNFWFSPKQPSSFVLLMIYNTKVYLLLEKKNSNVEEHSVDDKVGEGNTCFRKC